MALTASNQRGNGIVAVLAVIMILGFVALVGVKVTNKPVITANTIGTQSQTPIPTKINTAVDAESAEAALDSTDVDSDINPEQFDNDLNSLL